MSKVKLTNLVGKLAPNLRGALEQAAGAAMNQQVPAIEVEHWLVQLLADNEPLFNQFLQQQQVDRNRLLNELSTRLERLPKGTEGQPTLSKALSDLMESAWLLASVDFSHPQIQSLHLVLALLQPDPFGFNKLTLPAFEHVSVESLKSQISQLKGMSQAIADGPAQADMGAEGGALDKFTVSLTELARQGKIDPISGRNAEVRKAIDILCRKRQNNPIVVGEPGVGKTAIVEGLALRVVAGEVPAALQGVEIRSLDLGLLQAGASIKGEFENRLKDVINEVKSSPTPIVVFIDEAHTLIGAGGAAGQNDAANLLKPALARGEFKSIAATTWAEYKKYFEKDAALTRRFQVVKVNEPAAEDAMQMLRGVAQSLSSHHGVFICEDALGAAVHLSIRYLPGRQLPDKAISLLDTACAHIALTQGAKPEAIEHLEQQRRYFRGELAARETEQAVFSEDDSGIEALGARIVALDDQLASLDERWKRELALVEQVRTLKDSLTEGHQAGGVEPQQQVQMRSLLEELEAVQQEQPLVHAVVDKNAIATVISNWTGIPVGSMVKDEVAKLLTMEQALHQRVIGQHVAISELARSIRISRAGLTDNRKPVGVFLMCGPSGVGKTEAAMALADQVFGGGENLTVINMAEFKEEHKISMLLGSPAGYVGYGEGGVLTEAIRRNPYSVLVLDEMEKAHPGVHDMFYQIFDKGQVKDSEGREVDFRNTIIIMTTNAAGQVICDLCDAAHGRPESDRLVEQIRPELQRYFKPAFLGRTTIVPFYPLDDDELKLISEISLNRIRRKLEQQYGATFSWQPALVELVVSRNTDPSTGGRAVEQIINRSLMPMLAEQCITRLSEGLGISDVQVGISQGEINLTIA